MKKQSAEDYLDKLLNSVNEQTTEDEFEIEEVGASVIEMEEAAEDFIEDVYTNPLKTSKTEMYSRRVSKSEADFLMEFEAELEGEDFDDFLAGFDLDADEYKNIHVEIPKSEFPTEEPSVEESPIEELPLEELFSAKAIENVMDEAPEMSPIEDSFDLGGVDLGALLNEATLEESALEETVSEESPIPISEEIASGDIPMDDMFANLFGDDATGDAGDVSDFFATAEGDSSEGIDLGNLGEADLMSLLSGEGGLSDLGDMLSQSDSGEISMDGLDAFAAFAENEMAPQPVEEPKKAKKAAKGKGGLLDKIKAILLSDDDDDDEVELKKAAAPSADQLSGENAEILAQLDAEEKASKGGFLGKLKKEKAPKEKKEKKPKAPKPKKEKKPKVPKPKKEKKPKEVDNTPPLPKGPVFLIWVMVFSLFGLIYLGTNLMGYSSYVSAARSHYNNGNYAEAYQELLGLTLKEKDMELYNQVATLATVDSELNAYKVFLANEDYVKALDSLVCAAGRCELNEDNADIYECLGQMEILRKTVINELNTYGMTYEQALDMYHLKDREDYTIALYTKLKELGLN